MSSDNSDNKVQIIIKPPTNHLTLFGARCSSCSSSAKMLLSGGDLAEVQELHTSLEEFQQGKSFKNGRQRSGDLQTDYLVPAVSQVDPQDTHAMKDKLHGGQEVIQHCRLPNNKVQRSSSSTAMTICLCLLKLYLCLPYDSERRLKIAHSLLNKS